MNEENMKELYEEHLEEELKETIGSMGLIYNNISGESAHLRDTFFDSEKEYVLSLLNDEEIKDFIIEINRYHNASDLLYIAQGLVEKVENNLISYEEMEKVEKELIILLASIKDKILVKVKEKYFDYEEELHMVRSR